MEHEVLYRKLLNDLFGVECPDGHLRSEGLRISGVGVVGCSIFGCTHSGLVQSRCPLAEVLVFTLNLFKVSEPSIHGLLLRTELNNALL